MAEDDIAKRGIDSGADSEAEQIGQIEQEFGLDNSDDSRDYMPSSEQVESAIQPQDVEIYPVLLMAGKMASDIYTKKRESQGLAGKGFAEEQINAIAAPLSVALSEDLPILAEIGPWGATAIGVMAISAQVFMDELELKNLTDNEPVQDKS